MCGIAGIVTPAGRAPSRSILTAMTRTLRRRGPDAEGFHVDAEGGCGLGHRRLSIIDLSGGKQPLGTADGRVQVVVNGEIYNFESLRAELQSHGHEFVTRSDSEVVVHGYVQWGRGLFERLDGMFALAIWDRDQRRLLLARDRMGKKPLYYAFVGPGRDELIFGSELKALAAHPDMPRDVDPTALATYLAFEGLPEDEAIYTSAKKLVQGHALVFDRVECRAETFPFWNMSFAGAPGVPDMSRWDEDRMAQEVRNRLADATAARLISDVPLGVFLSGGLDSSLVTAAMAQRVRGKDIKTFSITFEDKSFDESEYARKVANHLDTDHHERRLSPKVMIDILPEVADFMCEPCGDASIIPTHLLSKFARETVTVALGGDGGDELFLGYPTFQADRVARRIDRYLPRSVEGLLGRGAKKAAGMLPVSHANFSFGFKVKRFAQGLGWNPALRHQAWMGSFMPAELERLFSERYADRALARNPYAIVSSFEGRGAPRDPLDALVYQYARLYLTGCVLVKTDRASMSVGLEVRAPMLDTRFVELACALPGHVKLRGFNTKHMLKQAARPWLPAEIIDRPKKGFGIPVGAWLRGPLRDMAFDLLRGRAIRQAGYFDPREIDRLLEEHDQGIDDHRKPLWTLLAFSLWHQRYGPGTRPAPVEDEVAPDAADPSSNVVLRC